MNYIKQILYELKNQKMVIWVSISGTALAIFLIMAIFMTDRLQNLAIAPDTNRSRILKGQGIDFYEEDSSGSSMGIHYDLAKKIYNNLDGISNLSYVGIKWQKSEVGQPGGELISIQPLFVDHEYWKMYDFEFISGSPFEKEEIEAARKIAIITESVARKLFGETNVNGRPIDVDNAPYIVKGVVKDLFPLLPDGTIGVFLNYSPQEQEGFGEGIFGETNTRLLMKENIKADYIKAQVKKRYEDINREMMEEGQTLVYHSQPYSSEELTAGSFGSNGEPNIRFKKRTRIVMYLILLLLPAINLSSMTRSRLRNRISEIGVRRTFGAKKKNIISQIFTENLLISFIGGSIGLCISLIFLFFLTEYFIVFNDPYSFGSALESVNVTPVIWNVFDFSVFFIAFGACFILNVLSATIPAWRASLVEPAIAIAKSR